MNIIHLLPPTCNQFMDDMVSITVAMEKTLGRNKSSPFREPLIKFLNRFPAETIDYFMSRLETDYGLLLSNIIEYDSSKPLQDELKLHLNRLVLILSSTNSGTCIKNVALILESLSHRDPMILLNSKQFLFSLRKHHDITKLLITYVKICPDDYDILFDIIEQIPSSDYIIKHFIKSHVLNYSIDRKRELLQKYLLVVREKVNVCKLLIVPMLSSLELVDILDPDVAPNVLNLLRENFWSLGLNDHILESLNDKILLQMLQLAATFLKYAPQRISDHRKEIIKFAWNFLKNPDIIVKQSAYVVLCMFIEAYGI
jgi:transformation/transcription domain-associated protein